MAAFPEGWMSSGQISRDGRLDVYLVIVGLTWSLGSELDEEEIRERGDGE